MQSVADNIFFGEINSKILPCLTTLVKNVIVPAINNQETIGQLSRQKDAVLSQFEENIIKSISDLDVAILNLQSSIILKPCPVDLSVYQAQADYLNASPETVSNLENLVADWCKQIDHVLAESEQMRREAVYLIY